jgi:hypothetical protein
MQRDPGERLSGERTLMRIYVGEGDRYGSAPLFRAIVDLLRQRGLAGATVMQCIMGYGANRAVHSYNSDITALEMPVVIECVDSEEHIQAVLPALDDMIGAGLITLERAMVIAYRAHHEDQTPGES